VVVGLDRDVRVVTDLQRGLKSEGRIGLWAYLAPGAAFAGGTLARDVRFLVRFGQDYNIDLARI
jgi:UDPglucose 6-dehydrogenase